MKNFEKRKQFKIQTKTPNRRTAIPLQHVWKDLFALDNSESARENPLPKVCKKVSVTKPRRHKG